MEAGVDGLQDRPKAGRRDHAVPADTVEQIVQTRVVAAAGRAQSVDENPLADAVGRTSGCVSDILRAHGVKPHVTRTFKVKPGPTLPPRSRMSSGCISTRRNTPRLC